MGLELVTGYRGALHITAEQDADLYRGFAGKTGLLSVGNKMEVSIDTANQISVSDGVCLIDGRECYIGYGDGETITIESGSQAMKRYDIVMITYTKDTATSVENVAFSVVQGTPSTSPSDPDYGDTDIREGEYTVQKPFCRVRIDGLTIEGIDMLMDEIPTLSGLEELVTTAQDTANSAVTAASKAQSTANTNATNITSIQSNYLPLSGGTMSGEAYFDCGNGENGLRFVGASANEWTCRLSGLSTKNTTTESVIHLYDYTNSRNVWVYDTSGNFIFYVGIK